MCIRYDHCFIIYFVSFFLFVGSITCCIILENTGKNVAVLLIFRKSLLYALCFLCCVVCYMVIIYLHVCLINF